jgi:phage protein D
MDATGVMNLAERQIAWPNKKDHEIAAEIFQSYGLSYEVEDTVVAHEEKVSTVLQAETDIRFLRRLAARNGFECHVTGATGYFRAPDLREPPQKTLVLSGGADANLVRATVRVDGTPATLAEIRRIDPMAKRETVKSLAASPRRALGAERLAVLRDGLPDGRVLLRGEPAAADTEMESRLRGAYGPADRFVKLSGEVDSRAYRAVLRAKRLITVRGLGESHSGLYYVNRVRHAVTSDGYQQTFEAYRNGVGLTGQEQFGPAAAPVPIPAGGDTGSRPAGNRVLPAQPSTALIPGGF